MADLSLYWVSDMELSIKTRNLLVNQYGPRVTLADIDAISDAEMFRTPNLGRRSVKEIREVIANVKAWPEPASAKPLAAIATLRGNIAHHDMIDRQALEELLAWLT